MKLINTYFGKFALSAFLLVGLLAASSDSTLASTRGSNTGKTRTAAKTMKPAVAKPHKKKAAKKKRHHARTSKAASTKKS